jgi:hypothetical protein
MKRSACSSMNGATLVLLCLGLYLPLFVSPSEGGQLSYSNIFDRMTSKVGSKVKTWRFDKNTKMFREVDLLENPV